MGSHEIKNFGPEAHLNARPPFGHVRQRCEGWIWYRNIWYRYSWKFQDNLCIVCQDDHARGLKFGKQVNTSMKWWCRGWPHPPRLQSGPFNVFQVWIFRYYSCKKILLCLFWIFSTYWDKIILLSPMWLMLWKLKLSNHHRLCWLSWAVLPGH